MKKNKTGYSTVSKRLGRWMLAMGVPCTNSKSIMKMKRGGGGESCKNIEDILSSKLATILEDPAEEFYDDMITCSYFHNVDQNDHHYCRREERQIQKTSSNCKELFAPNVGGDGDWQLIPGWKKVKDLQQTLKKTSCRLLMKNSSLTSSSAGFRFSLKRSYVYFLATSVAKGTLPPASGGHLIV